MNVETHLYVLLDGDGMPVCAVKSRRKALKLVGYDGYRFDHIEDCYPDVPVLTDGGES